MSEFDPARFIASMSRAGHNGMMGLRYHSHGDGWCALELPWRADLVGDPGTQVLASGPIITLMDMASGIATWLKSGQFRPHATLDLRIDYLRPAKPGNSVIGRSECYKLTKSISFVRGEAHDGDPGRPVAHVAGTFMFTDG